MFFKSKLLKYLAVILLIGVILFILFRSASRKEGLDTSEALSEALSKAFNKLFKRMYAIEKLKTEIEELNITMTDYKKNNVDSACNTNPSNSGCKNAREQYTIFENQLKQHRNELDKLINGDSESSKDEEKQSLDALKTSLMEQPKDIILKLEKRVSKLEHSKPKGKGGH
jgi:hypothetical protein